MTATTDLLADAFGRVREVVHEVLDHVPAEHLDVRVDPEANPIGWLVWHLARVQDDHVADVAGRAQVWTEDGWSVRFGLDLPVEDIGYGHSSDDVARVRGLSTELLTGYVDAVHARTLEFIRSLTDDDLARVVDERWDPPVTLGVRLVSVISDDLQHAGQAAYLAGTLGRGGTA